MARTRRRGPVCLKHSDAIRRIHSRSLFTRGWSKADLYLFHVKYRCASYLVKESVHGVYSVQKMCTFLRRGAMNLDDFILTCFCLLDEMLPVATNGKRLRQRGPMPKLAASPVITIEIVG